MPDVLLAGGDLVEQFVGSMDINIYVDEKGENLLFVVSNNTSLISASYHLADSYLRSENPAMGNMYQVYIFKEPITSAGFSNAAAQIQFEQLSQTMICNLPIP